MKKTYLGIVWNNIFNFHTIVMLLLMVLLISIGAASYAISSSIILINIGIGIAQEVKAKRAVERLSFVARSIFTVERGGETIQVATDELQIGDRVFLEAGKSVPVDGIVLDGMIELDESILTGESLSIRKTTDSEILAGSICKAGRATILAQKVGKDCYMESVKAQASVNFQPKSKIFNTLDRIIKVITVALIPLAILLLLSKIFGTGGDAGGTIQVITTVSSSILGMIPIGMFLLTSAALAVSVLRLSKKNCLLKDLYGIEMLATVDVLLLDKTGTMTNGELEVVDVDCYDDTEEKLKEILAAALEAGQSNNSTFRAFLQYVGETRGSDVLQGVPFSSDRKYSAVTTKEGSFVLGAPDMLLTDSDLVSRFAKKSSALCRRTILLAKVDGDIENIQTATITPLICYALEEGLRGDIVETMQWFRKNNVSVRVVSGDECATVCATAKKTGLFGAEAAVNCNGISDYKLQTLAKDTVIFGRTSPEQKALIVKTLQQKGHVVGMIGDGVNDILALKQADCSISFATASEAAREISRIVMMDSDFCAMPEIVREGRRVIGNVEKVTSLFIMKNAFVMFMTMLFAILAFIDVETFPFLFTLPRMMLMEIFVLGIPVFVLAMSHNRQKPKGSMVYNIVYYGIPSSVALIAGVGTSLIWGYNAFPPIYPFTPQINYIASIAAISLTIISFMYFFIIARPKTPTSLTVSISCVGLAILAAFIDYRFVSPSGFSFFNVMIPGGLGWGIIATSVAVAAVSGVTLMLVMWGLEKRFVERY